MPNNYLEQLKNQLKNLDQQIKETQQIKTDSSDQEIWSMADEEISLLEKQKDSLKGTIDSIENNSSAEENRSKHHNAIIEIRAAAGGDEAGIFANDLYRMYLKFAESQKWTVEHYSLNYGSLDNIKEVTFQVKSKSSQSSPFQLLKWESGVHRVQRIPITESSGRIHTSTATVAVLPVIEGTDIQINPQDLQVDTFRASGPGGQHVNKSESAIRITHIPSGIIVSCQDSRSQLKNRSRAMEILKSRLYQKQEEERKSKLGEERREQIGSGERAEKIRTYNFPQDRVTDHRINQSWFKISKIMDGDILEILQDLQKAFNQKDI